MVYKHPMPELHPRLNVWGEQIEDAKSLLGSIADLALARSQTYTPVDTGELLNSESVRLEEKRAFLQATAPHAEFVHEGTRFMRARPYFEQGIQDALSGAGSGFEAWAQDCFDRAFK